MAQNFDVARVAADVVAAVVDAGAAGEKVAVDEVEVVVDGDLEVLAAYEIVDGDCVDFRLGLVNS